jgi:Fe-S-cluster containining protein
VEDVFERYGSLLREVDLWFANCLAAHPARIACRRGCSACCRGLFDITLLDALYLRRGFDQLAEEVRDRLRLKAMARLEPITRRWPLFTSPWLLNPIPETDWDDIMPDDDETPCLLLSEEGGCLVYEHRPMTCRLNGIPLIDTGGEELFDEYCTLNFVDCDPLLLEELRHPFNTLFAQELLLFRELTGRLLGEPFNELDTLIPAAVLIDAALLVKTIGRAAR